MISKNAVLLLLALASFHNSAQADLSSNQDDGAYFTIEDAKPTPLTMTPWQAAEKGVQVFAQAASDMNLMRWVRHQGPPPRPTENYNRKLHFGTWVNDPHDDTCYNTRAKVLIRDSQEPVQFRTNNHCVVDTGRWEDPYTGELRTSARDVQIDHVVPLKNAFSSGAWTWNFRKRCLYANFLANSFHLLAVDGVENMSKGDSAPDQYLPPNHHYICSYLQEWLRIKLIWNLEMTESEAAAIRSAVQSYGCDLNQLTIPQTDLSKQRVATEDMQVLCEKMAKRFEVDPVRSH